MIDSIDAHYPTYKPNPAHVENLGQGKVCPDFSKLAQKFGANITPPRMPHGMSECLDPTLV